jgi:hypothetical protein
LILNNFIKKEDFKKNYAKEYYINNKEKLINHAKNYYS